MRKEQIKMLPILIVSCLLSLGLTNCNSEKLFNVHDYGAKADGTHKDTEAIGKAIKAAAEAGGGTVHFPKGHYLTGPIHLQSHVNLNFADGTVVKFSDVFDDYLPMIPIVKSGLEVLNFSPLIYGYKVTNVKLSGKAILDGSGQKWWDFFHHLKAEHEKTGHWNSTSKWVKMFLQVNANLLTKHHSLESPGFYRPAFFNPVHSSHITVEGLTFENSPWFTVTPFLTNYVTIAHVSVKNPSNAPNTDGIHPEACKHVVISNCFVDTGDDGIVITSEVNKISNQKDSSENITVRDSVVHSGHGGIVIGSAISGDVRHINAHNLHFEGTQRGIRIKSARPHGGTVEDITISGITMKNISHEGITINALYEQKHIDPMHIPPETFSVEKTPVYRNIHISNVTGDSKLGLQIIGLPEKHFEKIELKEVHLVAAKEEIIVNANVQKEKFTYKVDKHLYDHHKET